MKREIKFRGKRIDNGEWIYGYYFQYTDHSDETTHNIVPGQYSSKSSSNFHVDPETLGQFTGLYDKNGTEVYEGDVIEFDADEWGSKNNRFEVEWDNKNGFWDLGGGSTHSDMEFRTVIGNIHDTPELTEK